MKYTFPLIICLISSFTAYCQDAGHFLLGTHIDIIKNDYDAYFEKAQMGFEGNYFLSRKFTVSAGLEVWTGNGASAILGSRWYPGNDAFIRVRGLLGANNDFSIGGGWAKPMSEVMKFETMADFYFEGNFAIRAGYAILIRSEQ